VDVLVLFRCGQLKLAESQQGYSLSRVLDGQELVV
jgi:hypothetical protein